MTIQEPSSGDTCHLPTDSNTGQPLAPRAQPGYYPGFHTLSQQTFWDEATRKVVLARVEQVPPIRFLSQREAGLLSAIMDRIIPQDDRDEQHRIPIVNWVDDRLYTGRIDGYRFDDMPPDRDAYRLALQGIEAIAQHLHGRAFIDLDDIQQDEVLVTMHDGNPPAGDDIWQQAPVTRCWLLFVQDAIEAYYAHPYAWDEVGFGGPSYPRGYFRLENGQPEPWEVTEQRYEWAAPSDSLSDRYTSLGGPSKHRAPAGQEGTH